MVDRYCRGITLITLSLKKYFCCVLLFIAVRNYCKKLSLNTKVDFHYVLDLYQNAELKHSVR